MRVNITLLKKDLVSLFFTFSARKSFNWILFIILWVSLYLIGIYKVKEDPKDFIFISLTAAILLLIGYLFINFLIFFIVNLNKKGVLGQHLYEIKEKYLLEKTSINESKLQWNAVNSCFKTFFYIYIKTSVDMYILPKRDFRSKEEFETFYHEVKKKVTTKKMVSKFIPVIQIFFYLSLSAFLIVISIRLINVLDLKNTPKPPDYLELFRSAVKELYYQGHLSQKIDYMDPILNQRKLFLVKDVNDTNVEKLMKQLAYLDKKNPGKPIDLFIDTGGGAGDLMLISFIQSLRSPVNTHALGWCSSAGTMILAAGTGKRYAYEDSSIIVHINPYNETYEEDDEEYNIIDLYKNIHEPFWRRNAKLPDRFFPFNEEKLYYLTSQKALELGIIDEIVTRKTTP